MFGFRSFRSSPFLIFAALTSLAVGIGANSIVFSVVDAVVLRSLPFPDSGRVALLWQQRIQDAKDFDDTAPANFVDWREQNHSFEQLAAYTSTTFNLTETGNPEEVIGSRVTPDFFEVLQVQPILGRTFTPDEALQQAARVVVISYGLWERRFASDRAILGKQLRLNGTPHTIIGVMQPGWFLVSNSDIWVPLGWNNTTLKRDDHYLSVTGRLKPGVTFSQAKEDMDKVAHGLATVYPTENAGYGILVRPVDDVFPDQRDRRFYFVLMGMVGFVLLIACANVANLQLARANARTRDTATKAALGASRAVLIRQYLIESVVLGILGGILGLVFAFVGIRIIAASPTFTNYWNKITLNASVVIFTLTLSVLSGIIFGILPALHASRLNIRQMLEEAGRSAGKGVRFQQFGRILVAVEVMLALALLTVGVDMVRNFLALRNQDPGFDTKGLVTLRVSLPSAKYGTGQFSKDQIVTPTFDRIAELIRSMPGITDVSYITVLPRNASDPRARFTIPESRQLQGGEAPIASWRAVSSNYF
ncbi:MAG: ABC transporter permease [Candidatus Angelobacter sp.]